MDTTVKLKDLILALKFLSKEDKREIFDILDVKDVSNLGLDPALDESINEYLFSSWIGDNIKGIVINSKNKRVDVYMEFDTKYTALFKDIHNVLSFSGYVVNIIPKL